MRGAFSKALINIAKNDPSVVLLVGDHGYSLFDDFNDFCGGQFINAGIAEQNMVGMAAGLARNGFRPFVYALSSFVPIRVLEQIKLDVAHDDLPVVFLGDGAGFVYSYLGTSHQSTEDIACARAIPNLTVLSPADHYEMAACMDLAYKQKKSVYLRIGKSDLGAVHNQPISNLTLGMPLLIREGREELPALLATGSLVRTALEIAEKYIDSSVWSFPSIKPLDSEAVSNIASAHIGLVVLEEHSIIGGLGSAVSEITSEKSPTRVLRIGVNDRFSMFCGSYEYLLHEHELNAAAIVKKINDFIKAK